MNVTQQPLSGGSFKIWLKLLLDNGGVDFAYSIKALYISVLTFIGIPNRILARIKYSKKIAEMQIKQPPIFIIGHWRSGTTYLHNLIVQDKNLAYISNHQSFAPQHFLINKSISGFIQDKTFPKKRPMDNVEFLKDTPQEEEFYLANISTLSFYHGWYFPKKMKEYFQKNILFTNLSQQDKNKWKNAYIDIVKTAIFTNQKEILILKNPANTGRIKILLEMFPNAKFIHIYRNPYVVYYSTMNMYKKLMITFSLQKINLEEIEKNIFLFYEKIMNKFFDDKKLIPSENLVEVKYEDFEKDKLREIKRIYQTLNIANFDKAETNFKKYIARQKNYKKNQYKFDEQTMKKIEDNWDFALEKWGYSKP
jgi:hypothetical protein